MDKPKLNILICDDDVEFIPVLKDKIIESFSSDFKIYLYTYSKSREVLHNMVKYDFAFLDIDMPIISGFDLSSFVSNFNYDAKIVFVSSKNELVYESFRFKAYDFIRKDNLAEFSIKSKLWIKDIIPKKYEYRYLGRVIGIDLKSIILVYKNVNEIYIVTPNETFRERMKISEMFNVLNRIERCFIKPHRSIIINLYHVIDIVKSEIYLSNGERILIPRPNRKQIKTEIMEFKSRGKRC
ncbi:MAG: LytTR family transcriptional regulator DNA-binding domain-containing protein [Anaerorhabdus sp.]|uniref:LytR/AlgR family response regulator transcription factor n=1 Tax=Anaerorhabdus sp. TaxID=1872524 RepID=UPI002FCC29BF